MTGFNPYSPGFSIYFLEKYGEIVTEIRASILIHLYFLSIYFARFILGKVLAGLQSLFTWIFYLFHTSSYLNHDIGSLQSLFTWIFYLFNKIYLHIYYISVCFNPYSPGFSIYLEVIKARICL